MPAHQSYLSLNGGEVSPYLRHRTDLDKHGSALELLENFLPLPYGGIRKRPGLIHHDELAAATRLEAFHYSTSLSYLLCFTATGLVIRGSDGTVKDTIAFAFGDPFALQFAHINDLLWITSPAFHPQLLARVADANWTLDDVPFSYPPFLDENTEEALTLTLAPTLAPGAWTDATNYVAGTHVTHNGRQYTCTDAHLSTVGAAGNEPRVGKTWATVWRIRYLAAGDSATLTASTAGILTALSGSISAVTPSRYRLRIERELEDFETEVVLTGATTGTYSAPVVIQGGWTIITYGDWDGVVTLQLSFDGGTTWDDRRQWKSDKTRNVSDEGTEPRRCLARLLWTHDSIASTNKPRAVLSASSAYVEGIVEIEFFTVNYTVAVVTAVTDCEFGTTDLWTESAFSDRRGFPTALAVHDRRVIFAATSNNPVSLWASGLDDLLDFETGTDADQALFITLAATTQDPILWLASQRRLFVGTAGSEWVIGSEDSDSPLSPESFIAREYTRYGSASIPGLRVNDAVLFVERQGRRVREMAFVLDRESYDAADLTRLAEHITEGGLVQIAWQHNREPFLWAIRADGTLLAFAYSRPEKIFAWSRHTTGDGAFTSVAVLRNLTDDDAVWCVIERDGDYHLEAFATSQQAEQEAGNLLACFHVDSGIRGASTDGANQVDTPAHLDGIALAVLADGYQHTLTPVAGKLTIPHAAAVVHAGLPITSRAIILPADLVTQSGPTHGLRKRANAVNLDLYEARGGSIIYDDQERPIDYDDTTAEAEEAIATAPPLRTGWTGTTLPGGHLRDLQFEVRHLSPHPFTIRAAVMDWSLNEP